jgi:hypothetical protein
VNGDNADGYVIYCDSTADSGKGSYLYGTNPGYNIEDCSSQCFDDPEGVDCLAVVYVAPSTVDSGEDGHLLPGTCQFYEFVSAAVSSPGNALAVFENTFARRRKH